MVSHMTDKSTQDNGEKVYMMSHYENKVSITWLTVYCNQVFFVHSVSSNVSNVYLHICIQVAYNKKCFKTCLNKHLFVRQCAFLYYLGNI